MTCIYHIETALGHVAELQKQVRVNCDGPGEFSQRRHDLRQRALEELEAAAELAGRLAHALEEALAASAEVVEGQGRQLDAWATVVATERRRRGRGPAAAAPATEMVSEPVGRGLALVARRVAALEEVGPDLCFHPASNRFAVRLAGQILIGNIGTIYENCADPERVKECRVNQPARAGQATHALRCAHADGRLCRFYHPPTIFPGNTKTRNFFSTCGQYVAPNSPHAHNTNFCRYGSQQHLNQDMDRITPEEARRYEDFLAHNVLCWLLLRRYKPLLFQIA